MHNLIFERKADFIRTLVKDILCHDSNVTILFSIYTLVCISDRNTKREEVKGMDIQNIYLGTKVNA